MSSLDKPPPPLTADVFNGRPLTIWVHQHKYLHYRTVNSSQLFKVLSMLNLRMIVNCTEHKQCTRTEHKQCTRTDRTQAMHLHRQNTSNAPAPTEHKQCTQNTRNAPVQEQLVPCDIYKEELVRYVYTEREASYWKNRLHQHCYFFARNYAEAFAQI